MTCRDMERKDIVDELLLDAGSTDAPGLRQALLSMRSFADLPAPAPSEALATMFAGPHDEVSKRRWRHKHRTAVVSVAVVAAMGFGVSGVAAASSGFTRTPAFVDELLGNFAPQPSAAAPELPTPDAPKVSTEPAPSGDPAALPPATESPAVSRTPETSDAAVPLGQAPVQPAPGAQPAPEAHPADVGNVPVSGAAGEPPRAGKAKPPEAEPREAKLEAKLGQAGFEPTLPDVVEPTAAPTATAKPAPAHGNKPSQALPSLGEKPAHEQFQSFVDKLKQWLRGAGH
jgi:hypothetical protein